MAKSQPITGRLTDSSSPYLRQHAGNPVDWWPWCDEALAEARHRGVPIFLSVGYAACHWCHVMAHEVFENPEIAAAMNSSFVNIKVDREERPDIDEIYMLATQLFSGSGGWPMSVWLTPDLIPFYAGTYFPPVDGYGRPGFPSLVAGISHAWRTERDQVAAQAAALSKAMRQVAEAGQPDIASSGGIGPMDVRKLLIAALEQANQRFDRQYGGMGGSPKFPPHQMLLLWLTLLEVPPSDDAEICAAASAWRSRLVAMLTITLDGMQFGGIHDHVGGGMARYSTDEKWHVPHFEKMLYDNAQLAEVYARAATLLQRDDYARTARQIIDFWLHSMCDENGLCLSSLDADSEGAEGIYYTWTWQQLGAALGDDPKLLAFARDVFDVSREGNWETTNVLQISPSAREKNDYWKDARWKSMIDHLAAARQTRPPPETDRKVLTGWNGLMLSALSRALRLHGAAHLRQAGERMVDGLKRHCVGPDGQLLRSTCGAVPGGPAFLDDYAYLAKGLVDWALAYGGPVQEAYLSMAEKLIHSAIQQFMGDNGQLFTSAPAHKSPLFPMRADHDNATPAPAAVLIGAMLALDRCRKSAIYTVQANRCVRAMWYAAASHPTAAATLLAALIRSPQVLSDSARVGWRIGSITAKAGMGWRIEIIGEIPPTYELSAEPKIIADCVGFPQPPIISQSCEAIPNDISRGGSSVALSILIGEVNAPAEIKLTVRSSVCTASHCLPEAMDTLIAKIGHDIV